MEEIGFHESHRHYSHPGSGHIVEFPTGPLAVGNEPIREVNELKLETGILKVISPTECVKDRLSWYYHMGDQQCLHQAIQVTQNHDVDLSEIRRWSHAEGKLNEFTKIESKLQRTVT